MKTAPRLLCVTSAALLFMAGINPALAQKQTGQDRLVPAPPTEPVPTAGQNNPAKTDGPTDLGAAQAKSPLETNDKAELKSDDGFLKEAAISGETELAASKLATEHAADPKVKTFAAGLVKDHEKLASDLKSAAAAKKVELPAAPDAKRQATLDKLGKLEGNEFDRAYVEQMANDHQEAVSFYEMRAKLTKDAALKTYIASALPTLRKHGEAAKALYVASKGK